MALLRLEAVNPLWGINDRESVKQGTEEEELELEQEDQFGEGEPLEEGEIAEYE